jgi:hypothetical protein
MQAMLRVQYDPLVAALNNMISFEQVQQVGHAVSDRCPLCLGS